MSRRVTFTRRLFECGTPGPHFTDRGGFGGDLDITDVRCRRGQPSSGSGAPHS